MNALETIGVLALGYLAAGTICTIAAHTSTLGDNGWLSAIILTFVHLMCWPVVLAAVFAPDLGRVFDDTVRTEGGAAGQRSGEPD